MCLLCHCDVAAALVWLGAVVPHRLGMPWPNLFPGGPQPEGVLTELAV